MMMKMMKQRLLLLRCWLKLLKTQLRMLKGCGAGGVELGGALATGRTRMCASRVGREAVTWMVVVVALRRGVAVAELLGLAPWGLESESGRSSMLSVEVGRAPFW